MSLRNEVAAQKARCVFMQRILEQNGVLKPEEMDSYIRRAADHYYKAGGLGVAKALQESTTVTGGRGEVIDFPSGKS